MKNISAMIHECLRETGYSADHAEINYSMKKEKDSSTPAQAAEDTKAAKAEEASSQAKVVKGSTPANAARDSKPAQTADT